MRRFASCTWSFWLLSAILVAPAGRSQSQEPPAAEEKAQAEKAPPLDEPTRRIAIDLIKKKVMDPKLDARQKASATLLQNRLEGRRDADTVLRLPENLRKQFEKLDLELLDAISKDPATTEEQKAALEKVRGWLKAGGAALETLKVEAEPPPAGKKELAKADAEKSEKMTKDAPAETPSTEKPAAEKPDLKDAPADKKVAKGAEKKGKAADAKAAKKKAETAGRKIQWRANLPAALADAANSGKPLFVYFYDDVSPFSKKLEEETFVDGELAARINASFIPAKVDTEKNEDATEEYAIEGPPTIAIIRYNKDTKEVVERLRGFRDASTLSADLKKVVAKIGELEPIAGPERLQRSIELAEKAIAEGRYSVAYAMLKKLAEREENLVEIKKAREMIGNIEQMAADRLEEARGVVESKNYIEAATLLKRLQRDFEGAPAVDAAKELEQKLADDPVANTAVRKAAAQSLFDQAAADLKNRRLGLALSRLETLVNDYPEQPVAKHAQWRLEQMRKDPILIRKARDEDAAAQCRVWLSLARTWKKNRKYSQANEYYDRIIETFPGTTFAQTAEREKASEY